MVQLGLDIQIPVRGFFTIENDLLDRSLAEMEDLLGFAKGRLKQGADIFILNPPVRTFDFERMGTTVFPGHRFSGSNLQNAINGDAKKEHDLKMFQRKRPIKVVPLMIHLEAMRRHLTEEEYRILRETDTKGKSVRELKAELKQSFRRSPETVRRIENLFDKSKEIYERSTINDDMYPSAVGTGVPQWELKVPSLARCVCRMLDYTADRYQKVF